MNNQRTTSQMLCKVTHCTGGVLANSRPHQVMIITPSLAEKHWHTSQCG